MSTLELFVKSLKLHLKTHKDHFVTINELWYDEVEFDMDKLLAEIDEFSALFQKGTQ